MPHALEPEHFRAQSLVRRWPTVGQGLRPRPEAAERIPRKEYLLILVAVYCTCGYCAVGRYPSDYPNSESLQNDEKNFSYVFYQRNRVPVRCFDASHENRPIVQLTFQNAKGSAKNEEMRRRAYQQSGGGWRINFSEITPGKVWWIYFFFRSRPEDSWMLGKTPRTWMMFVAGTPALICLSVLVRQLLWDPSHLS